MDHEILVFEKRCRKCGETKPANRFPRAKANKDGLHAHCHDCRSVAAEAWKKAHPEWVKAYRPRARANVKRCKDKNREKVRAEGRAYHHRVKNTEEYREYQRLYMQTYRLRKKEGHRQRNQARKLVVIAHYGGMCFCCGEADPIFLAVDHKNNDGREHRKVQTKGGLFYKWIIDNDFPSDLQIACMNCNWGKHRNNGICPHEAARGGILKLAA